MSVYTRLIGPSLPLPSDPLVVSAYIVKAASSTVKVPIPSKGVLAHAEAHTIVAVASADLVYTIKNDSSTTLGAITVAQSGSAVGTEDEWVKSATNNNDYILDNGHIQVAMGGASAGACMLYFVLEGASNQQVAV